MEERRKAARRELESRLVIKRIDEDDHEEVMIDIIDVSKSGIGFSCDKLLTIGAVYESYLRIWTMEIIHAFLEITRAEEKDGRYEYGAFFVGMAEVDALRIEVYNTIKATAKTMDDQ